MKVLQQHSKKAVTILFAMLVSSILMIGCNKDTVENQSTSTKNEYLTFSTPEDFMNTVSKLQLKTLSVTDFMKQHSSFVSLDMLYRQALSEDETNHENELKKALQDPNFAKTGSHEMSKTVLKYPNSFIYTAENGIELNISNTYYAFLINADGIVKIGKYIVN